MTRRKADSRPRSGRRRYEPDDLGRRYLRLRHEDVLHDERGRLHNRVHDTDDCWDLSEPGCECCTADTEDLGGFHLERLLDDIVGSDTLPAELPGQSIFAEATARDSTNVSCRDGTIEGRLLRLIEASTVVCREPGKLYATLANAIRNPGSLRVVREYGQRIGSPDLARRICLFAPFWLDDPCEWDPGGDTSLLDHLFVRYPVPGFLYPEWLQNKYSVQSKWIVWFIVIGQGGSLRRAAEKFGWRIPARLLNHLAVAPSNISPTLACIHAEVARLGGTNVEFDRLIRNRWFVLDPTEYSANDTHDAFWRDTVRWLARHRADLNDDEATLVLDWALHEHTERARGDSPRFSWNARSSRATVDRARRYQADRDAWGFFGCGPELQWDANGWSWQLERSAAELWSFVELTSSAQLRDEGRGLRHCVASYAARCAAGHSAIVSARRNDEPCLTIELAPRSRRIIQVRGMCNREATRDEWLAIAIWLEEIAKR